MSLSKLTPIRFSSVHGQHVDLSKNKCSSAWRIDKHWGICITNRPLSKGEKIDLEITGSGHMYIGILNAKPIKTCIVEGKSVERVVGDNWFHFRLKNNIYVASLEKTSSKEVTFYSGVDNEPEVFKIETCWVCCDFLFGDLEVKILTTEKHNKNKSSFKNTQAVCFDSVCGSNISLSSEATTAKVKHANPSATCCTDRPVVQGEILEVKVEPVQNARWTYVHIYMSNHGSKCLKIDRPNFECSGSDVKSELLPLTKLKNSQATFVVRVTEEKIAYTVRGEERFCEVAGLDLSKPIYVYFDLFRVSLTLNSIPSPTLTDVVDYPKVKDVSASDYDDYITPCLTESDKSFVKSTASGVAQNHQLQTAIDEVVAVKQQENATKMKYPTVRRKESLTGSGLNGNGHTRSEDAEGASGPLPQGGITVDELGDQIASLLKDNCSAQLNDIKQKQEECSANNQEILNTVICLQKQLSESGVTSESKPSTDMGSQHQKSVFEMCIQRNFYRFLNDMYPDSVIDFLFQYEVINADQMEKLHGMYRTERKKKNREILHIMRRKPQQMQLFQKALINSGNQDLAKLFNE